MNKILIPALLVATVMVAGMFAFAPVEQASTVHTSDATLDNQSRIVEVTDTCTAGADDDCITATLAVDEGAIYSVLSVTVTGVEAGGGNQVLGIDTCIAETIDIAITVADVRDSTARDFPDNGNISTGVAGDTDLVCDDTSGDVNVDDLDVITVDMIIEITASAADPVLTVDPET